MHVTKIKVTYINPNICVWFAYKWRIWLFPVWKMTLFMGVLTSQTETCMDKWVIYNRKSMNERINRSLPAQFCTLHNIWWRPFIMQFSTVCHSQTFWSEIQFLERYSFSVFLSWTAVRFGGWVLLWLHGCVWVFRRGNTGNFSHCGASWSKVTSSTAAEVHSVIRTHHSSADCLGGRQRTNNKEQ